MVRRYWEDLWGGSDLSVVDELFSEPYVRHNRNGTQRLTRAQLKSDFRRYWESLGNVQMVRIDDLAGAADRVWSRATIRGRDGESGDPRVVTFLHQARVAEGRLVETWSLTAPDVDWRSR